MRTANNILFVLLIVTGITGCAQNTGPVFPTVKNAPQWPPAPAPARIRYVGQLTGSAELKASEPPLSAVGRAIFGGTVPQWSFKSPIAVCTDGGDRVFVADTADQVIHVLDLKSRVYQRWTPTGRKLATPVGLACDANGRRLLVSDSGASSVLIFSLDGRFIGELAAGQFKRPCGLAVDPRNGRIFVADVGAHQVVVVSPSGQVLQRIGSRGTALGQFNYPTYVALDKLGRLYVSDSLNFRVQLFGVDLQPIRQIGSQGDMPGYFGQPKGVTVDPDGHLYAIDSRFEAVEIFDDAGTLLMDFGEEGNGLGEFWLPAGIFIDPRGRIWVADSFNHRVQVFDYVPEEKP